MEPIRRCRFVESDGFHTCGSYAFNLHQEGIQQGDLCDRHYWQRIAHEQREELLAAKAVIRQLHAALNEYYLETVEVEGYSDASTRALLALAAPFLLED